MQFNNMHLDPLRFTVGLFCTMNDSSADGITPVFCLPVGVWPHHYVWKKSTVCDE